MIWTSKESTSIGLPNLYKPVVTHVLVPVRYPLSETSRQTVETAVEVTRERGGELTVLHVNRSDLDRRVTRTMLKTAVERVIAADIDVRYVVRRGPLVEETILEEVTEEDADIVVVGRGRSGIIGRVIRLLFDEPNVETYLRNRHSGEILAVPEA